MKKVDLMVFDMDGVITDEKPYWDSARQAVIEVLKGLNVARPETPDDALPQNLIYWLKNRAINNNWDVAYVAACAWICGLSENKPGRGFFSGRGRPIGGAADRVCRQQVNGGVFRPAVAILS